MKVMKRFNRNPFIENMNISVENKRITISPMGKNNDVLINQLTGEMKGTHVGTYKTVDSTKFVKLFTENIGMIFDLSKTGVRILGVVVWAVQEKAINKDIVTLTQNTLKEFLEKNKNEKIGLASFKKGISELVDAQIIARHMDRGVYFINPNFIFNGDRVAFTKIIAKNQSSDQESEDDIKKLD